MKHELSDLLLEAKADAPPWGYDASALVEGGRRLRRRRRNAWALTGTVATVVALSAGVAVVRGLATYDTTPAAATKPAPVAPFAYPAAAMTGNIKGFQVDGYTVTGTVQVTPGYQIANVLAKDDGGGDAVDAAGGQHDVVHAAGVVTVYRAGAFDPKPFTSGSPVTVNGHPGFTASYQFGLFAPAPAVAWQYADGAWAVVAEAQDSPLRPDQLIDIARGVTSAVPAAPTVAFRTTYLPPGFEPTAVGTVDWQLTVMMPGQSYLELHKGDLPYRNLTMPVYDDPIVGQKAIPMIELTVYPAWSAKYSPPAGKPRNFAFCADQSLCYRATDDGKYQVEANGGGTLPDSELLKVVKGLVFADPGDPSTWTPLAG
jgi:hypothetical protein